MTEEPHPDNASVHSCDENQVRDPLDQALFVVDASTFAKFQELLDRPLPVTDKLRRLLDTKAPWEK